MILKTKDKEITLNATMRKIVAITKNSKVDNLKDVFFKALNTNNYMFLADLIIDLSETVEGKRAFNGDINQVYDFMEAWVQENNSDYEALYKEIAEELNVKSFFGKKMSEEELKAEISNPLAGFDINEIMKNSTQKVIGEVVAEEFKGYKG